MRLPEDLEDGRSESGKVDDCDYSASSVWLRHIPVTVQSYPRSQHPFSRHNTLIPPTDLLKKNAKVGDQALSRRRSSLSLQGTTES